MERKISYDLAKLAYSKGFRNSNPSFGYITSYYHPISKSIIRHGRTGKCKVSELYYRSSLYELQTWIRDIHNINIYVGEHQIFPYYEGTLEGFNYGFSYIAGCASNIYDENNSFKYYEDALENALLEVLNLI